MHAKMPQTMGNDADPAIKVERLVTRMGGKLLHDSIDLTVRRGEIMGVVGGSGTGKSVLLREIIGLNRPDSGRIEVLGQETTGLGRLGLRDLETRWGVLFQDGALFSSQTVAENIQVPMREHLALSQKLMDELTILKLAMVGLSPDTAFKFPSQLSGGMRKRAGLARALALDAEILFLDEPTAGLDPISASQFDALVCDLQKSLNLTVFMVTHDLDTLRAAADRIAVLVDRKMTVGTIEALVKDENPWIHQYFNGTRGRAALGS